MKNAYGNIKHLNTKFMNMQQATTYYNTICSLQNYANCAEMNIKLT